MAGKKGRSGRRTTEVELAMRFTAAEVLDRLDQQKMWNKYLRSEDERISLDCWKYLNDRVHGKPKQAIESSGPDGGPIQAEIIVQFVKTGVDGSQG